MVKIYNNDGKTKETAIKITEAADHREGWEFIYDYMDRHKAENGYDSWDREDLSSHDEHGFLKELSVFKFFANKKFIEEIWIDCTTLFHVWDK